MKRTLFLFALLATVISASGQLQTRLIARTNEITFTASRNRIAFYQGETVTYQVYPLQGGAPAYIPTNTTALWFATDDTLTNYFIFCTGTVRSATGGPIEFTLASSFTRALDDSVNLESAVVVYDGSPTGQPPVLVADRTQIDVLWSPGYDGVYRGPISVTNLYPLDASTPVLSTFWTANALGISQALGIDNATGLQHRITIAESDINDLQAGLDDEIDARVSALDAETSNRTAAIQAETLARTSEIEALGDVYVLRGDNPDEPSVTGLDEVGARQFTGDAFSTADSGAELSSSAFLFHGLTLDVSGDDHRLRAPADGALFLGASDTNTLRVDEEGFFVLAPMEVDRPTEFWDEVYFSKRYKTNRTTRIIRTAASSLTASTPQTVPAWTNIDEAAFSGLTDTRIYIGFYTSGISLVTYTGYIENVMLSLMYSTDSNEWVQFSSSDSDTVSAIAKVGRPAHLAVDAQFYPIPLEGGIIVTARVTGIDVSGWLTPDAIGETEDLTGLHVLFDDPESDLEPVNLRTLDRELSSLHGNIPFSAGRASKEINLDRYPLVFGPQWSARQTNQTLSFSYVGQPVFELHNGATVSAEIIGWGEDGGTNWMSVVSTPIHQPILQYSEDLLSWAEYGTYDTSEQEPGVWLLSWVDGSDGATYFRAVVTGEVSVASRAVLLVPLDMNGRAISNAVLEAGILRSIAGAGLEEVAGQLALADDYALAGDLSAETSNRTDAVSAEAAARIGADASLTTGVAQVAADLAAEISNRTDAVSAEAAARIGADASLTTGVAQVAADLAAETSNRTDAVSAEAAARIGADASLTAGVAQVAADLAAETSNRTDAVSAEAAARIGADASLTAGVAQVAADLAAETSNRTDAVSAEAAARIGADASLTAGVAQVAADLAAETSNRTDAVSAEAAARIGADAALTAGVAQVAADLAAETSNRTDAVSAEAAARIGADAALTAGVLQVAADLDDETSNRTAAVSAEAAARIGADAALTAGVLQVAADLDDETSNRAAAVSAEAAARIGADASLTAGVAQVAADLAAETSNRTDAVSAEAAARIGADAALTAGVAQVASDLATETSNRTDAVTYLESLISAANTVISNLNYAVSNTVNAARLGGYQPDAFFFLSDFQQEMSNRVRMVSGVTNVSSPGGYAWVQLVSTGGGTNELWVYGDHALGTNTPGWAIFDARAP
jgi:hypothetical protein